MKKLIILIVFATYSIVALSQGTIYNINGVTTQKIFPIGFEGISLDIGKKVMVRSSLNDPAYGNCYLIQFDESHFRISMSDLKKIKLNDPNTIEELWGTIRLNADFDQSLYSRGFQYDLRKDLEDETIDVIQNFERYDGFFYDQFLEDYIQSLLIKIHTITLNDGRPGTLGIKILKSSTPNAYCMPTGTIIITTGLLSTIRSEDELIGILAHEAAHFVLDHQIININKAVARQKRADFWSGMTTAIAAASEIYLSLKNDYVPTGSITLATAILSTSIANSISERMGTKYNIEQELEADNIAVLILSFLNKDQRSLSAALIRIQNYYALNKDFFALSLSGAYPSLPSRIEKMGTIDPATLNNTKYDQIISLVNTFNTINEFELNHLSTALELSNRNIESGVGIEDDYLLKAMIIRLLSDSPEKNLEALGLIELAKGLNVVPRGYLFKEEGITLLRIGKYNEALDAFNNYIKYLECDITTENPLAEIEWSRKMIYKTNVLSKNQKSPSGNN